MQPSDVSDEMQISAAQALYVVSCGELEAASHEMRAPIAAAINVMPDDLLRKLVAERGCVMVPRADMRQLLDAMMEAGYESDEPVIEQYEAMLAATDSRQQAQDDGKEGT